MKLFHRTAYKLLKRITSTPTNEVLQYTQQGWRHIKISKTIVFISIQKTTIRSNILLYKTQQRFYLTKL